MSTDTELRIGVLLPDVLGTYSDIGNAVVLAQRAIWRGIAARILELTADTTPPAGCDIYLLGGGEDTAQIYATQWLARHRALRHAMDTTATTLAVCAGLQILGTTVTDPGGRKHAGLGLIDLSTTPRRRRAVGEVITRCELPGVGLLTGFENHRGATTLGPGVRPLGQLLSGTGNGGTWPTWTGRAGATEGAVAGGVVATYLHGPVLARNPALADHLLARATGHPISDDPIADDRAAVPDLPALRSAYLAQMTRRRVRLRPRPFGASSGP